MEEMTELQCLQIIAECMQTFNVLFILYLVGKVSVFLIKATRLMSSE